MATTKKTTKPSSKAKSKTSTLSKIEKGVRDFNKVKIIPGYGALAAGKKLDDIIEKKDPNLAKSKSYRAVKSVAKTAKGAADYIGDSIWNLGKGAVDVVTNPGKYIEKGAKAIGKAAYRGGKAIDDYIEKADPSLSKSKLYGAIKGTAKKAPKAIETGVGVAGKTAVALSPFKAASIALTTRETAKGAKKIAKKGAKAADDYIEKADPNLAKSKTYGAVKGVAKSILGVDSGSKTKKASTTKTSTTKKKTSSVINPGDNGYVWGKNKNKSKTTTTTKPSTKSTPTVSELWKQKTGTSWSEAKKQGLTDGSLNSNLALMKKLKSGEISKSSMSKPKTQSTSTSTSTSQPASTKETKKVTTGYSGSGIGAMERAEAESKMRKGGMVRRRMKTGGMVNSNARVSAIKKAGSKGVRSGSNTRVSASKVARGRVGGTSTAPRTAVPKAKMGMSFGLRRKR